MDDNFPDELLRWQAQAVLKVDVRVTKPFGLAMVDVRSFYSIEYRVRRVFCILRQGGKLKRRLLESALIKEQTLPGGYTLSWKGCGSTGCRLPLKAKWRRSLLTILGSTEIARLSPSLTGDRFHRVDVSDVIYALI